MESSKISQEDQPTESDDDASITSTENESDSSNSEPEQTAASLNQTHRHTERTALTGLDTRRRGDDESKPCHRVTNLSSGPADTMAFSVSTMVASIILLPLETLLVRSVATAYLTTSGPSSASCYWLREEIYPTGSWFGMGLRGGRAMDYARKMVLCFGMEMVLGYGVWQIGAGVTWWIGKWFFNWGKLQGSP
ncbi:MAG: hypothetical protein LQ352_001250 [Teloschistes flavicans]|nr:MAG: hypothetical protein LQ352_001250 [Teloschistes flavicans]